MNQTPRSLNFTPMHQALQRQVDLGFLPGVSSAVLIGGEVVDTHCTGWADKEAGIALRSDHIFRMFSNSKLITSVALLTLWEDGLFELDDPVEDYIPQLGQRQVLKPGAKEITDTEPAASPITIRQLMSHSSGLSYGLLDPGTLLFKAYTGVKILNPMTTLAQKMDQLAGLPLKFHPGTGWEYSVATDVLGRLVEVFSDQSFGAYLKNRIFDPLGMTDTGFFVPTDEQSRLCAYYGGVDFLDPMKPGLVRYDDLPYPGAYRQRMPNESGGGGLVSTLGDTVRFIQSLLPGDDSLLSPHTLTLMQENQLAEGVCIQFPAFGRLEGKGHGLAGCVTMTPGPFDPSDSTGELQWGGLGGTHWWINTRQNIAGILMTQRHMGFWNPYAFEFKKLAYMGAGLR